jgi:hypothetical protein
MDGDATRGTTYRIVFRGELGDDFAFLFGDLLLERVDGMTVLTGRVLDQAHLHGLLDQAQELGIGLISVQAVAEANGSDTEASRP